MSGKSRPVNPPAAIVHNQADLKKSLLDVLYLWKECNVWLPSPSPGEFNHPGCPTAQEEVSEGVWAHCSKKWPLPFKNFTKGVATKERKGR